jgi:hypothetical protein
VISTANGLQTNAEGAPEGVCGSVTRCVAAPPAELIVREASGAMTPERRRGAIIVVAVGIALILISDLARLSDQGRTVTGTALPFVAFLALGVLTE